MARGPPAAALRLRARQVPHGQLHTADQFQLGGGGLVSVGVVFVSGRAAVAVSEFSGRPHRRAGAGGMEQRPESVDADIGGGGAGGAGRDPGRGKLPAARDVQSRAAPHRDGGGVLAEAAAVESDVGVGGVSESGGCADLGYASAIHASNRAPRWIRGVSRIRHPRRGVSGRCSAQRGWHRPDPRTPPVKSVIRTRHEYGSTQWKPFVCTATCPRR
eukprot:ctg_1768.g389